MCHVPCLASRVQGAAGASLAPAAQGRARRTSGRLRWLHSRWLRMQVVQCSAWYVASAVGPSRPYVSPITSAHTGATVSAPAAAVYIAERALVDAVEHTVSVATCAWPWLLVLSGQVNALEGFLLWLYPWAVTGAIWTVMTQVSHVQEDCQQPPTGAPDDYFRWQVESAVDLPPTSPAPRSAVQESCSFRTLRPGLALGLQSRQPGHAGQFDLAQLVVWAAAAHEAMWQDPIRACGQPTVFGTCSVVLDPKPDGKRLKWWLRRWRYPTSWRPGVSSPRTGVVSV